MTSTGASAIDIVIAAVNLVGPANPAMRKPRHKSVVTLQ
jgi:hypothetical protein